MTRSEWIENNNLFFHVTEIRNLGNILEEGLNGGNVGICVIRSQQEEVIKYLCHKMFFNNTPHFAIIKIEPRVHNIPARLISADPADGIATADLHNFIRIKKIRIVGDDNKVLHY